jgi:prepilin-type processing-associated H-X9-DG protein
LPYFCPWSRSKSDIAGRRYSAYFGVRGPNTLFPDGRGLNLRNVTDGTSNTIAIVEACGVPIVWTEPRDIDLAEQDVGVNLPGRQPGQSSGVISSYHPAGGHVAMADGSVRFVSDQIDPQVLKAALTANGGEAPSEF